MCGGSSGISLTPFSHLSEKHLRLCVNSPNPFFSRHNFVTQNNYATITFAVVGPCIESEPNEELSDDKAPRKHLDKEFAIK
jgi:hypothetical protein